MMKGLTIAIFLILNVLGLSAAKKEYQGRIKVTPLQLEQIGDSLYIAIDINIEGANVNSEQSISLIPILISPGKERELSEVQVKGRLNYLTTQRSLALMSKSDLMEYKQNAPYAILKGYKSKDPKEVKYRKSIYFEPWMRDARLDIQEDLCGCGLDPRSFSVSQLINQVQLEKIIQPYNVKPYLAYIQPQLEAIKKREMVGEAFLDFVVNKIDIRPDYMSNPRELKKITDMMEAVRADATITVRGINVEGYASPEGTLKNNRRLSEGRASALVGYLVPRFDYPKDMYKVVFGGENWIGLRDTVMKSDMKNKDAVLANLDNTKISDEVRKMQLKYIDNVTTYNYMLKRYYPYLRKAICKIDYEIKGFEVVEAKEIFKTRPQNLSLNEMYLVANTYEVGSQEFADVFETAVRLYPADETANLNAAAATLSRKDTVSAERYLAKVKTASGEYHNAMGVLMMLKGDYTKAEEHLNKASNAGIASAKENLAELNKKRENIEQLNKTKKQ